MTIIRKYHTTIAFALCVSVLFVVLCLINRSNAFAFGTGGCDGECNKCHSFTKAEAGDIMKKLKVPDAKVLDVRDSPIKGLWEVSIDTQGKRGIFYVPFSKNYIVQGSR